MTSEMSQWRPIERWPQRPLFRTWRVKLVLQTTPIHHFRTENRWQTLSRDYFCDLRSPSVRFCEFSSLLSDIVDCFRGAPDPRGEPRTECDTSFLNRFFTGNALVWSVSRSEVIFHVFSRFQTIDNSIYLTLHKKLTSSTVACLFPNHSHSSSPFHGWQGRKGSCTGQ